VRGSLRSLIAAAFAVVALTLVLLNVVGQVLARAGEGISPVNTAPPTISGTPRDGETLTADRGAWSGEPLAFAYQWRRCDAQGNGCVDIDRATGATFTLTATDVGSTIRVTVSASNSEGQSSATSTSTAPVDPAPPVNVTVPIISGIAHEGETLTVDTGTWTGTPPLVYKYQWRRCDGACTSITGATDASYTLTAAEVGWRIRIRVYAANAAGTAYAFSNATDVVAAAVPPVNVEPPTTSGVARQGETLAATTGTWTGSSPIVYSYRWRRCDLKGWSCITISGAIAPSYELTAADVGSRIRVRITATNAAGSATSYSKATAVVLPPCPSFGSSSKVGTVTHPEARELSGIAASRRNLGVLWTHNDSGDSERLFAISSTAVYLGTYIVSGNNQHDWEDIAVGPGPESGLTYLYIGSVGGNTGRHSIYAYRIPEPLVSPDQSPQSVPFASVTKLRMQYPGVEQYNAETFMVDPLTHDIYVVTKSWTGYAKVFRYPAADQDPAITFTLQLVKTLKLPGGATGGDFSPAGDEIVIKGYEYTYLWQRPRGATVAEAVRTTPCEIPHGPGEAIGFAADGSGYFTVAEGNLQPLLWFPRQAG